MASEEYQAFQKMMAERPAPPPPANLQELRDRIDTNAGGLPLADGVTAEAVEIGGVSCIVCRPDGVGDDAPVLVYLHGGGFRMASALAYRSFGSHIAKAMDGRVVLVDYRLAPENPFPAALDDTEAVYRGLLDQGVRPEQIAVAGDSAGGGLTASLAIRTLANGPTPAALICSSPVSDLTASGASYETNAASDTLWSKSSAEEVAELYLAGHDPSDPEASPLFGSWQGAPPLLIQVGSIETLLDDSRRLAEVAGSSDVDVTVHVYDDMPHVWQMSYPAFPEAVEAVTEIAHFVRQHTS
jgi:monoterpene epsilon-lactone hydrolase